MEGQNFLPKLRVKKLDEKAFIPVKGSEHAAGYDLFSIESTVIAPHEKKLISTGIAMQIPVGNYGRVAPRSGLAVKNFIDVGAGVIDADYRGEVKVLLFNFSTQLIIEKYTRTDVEEAEILDDTERGEGGFGSTGVKLDNQPAVHETVHLGGVKRTLEDIKE
ncbi:dutpase putaive [Stylonychia lemnae]|uniref:Deoxyuridine 5'-triphosphate nucleotidohydrolase n=1 Tax=Stylonychia lemnae TaxID=5949 RepID=A0A078ACI3_STYLE|nr:dutpase putaive [Stylonychia lemnae]|eukprot:CDW79960.1 dutpase putaive [Stylonychia lemnae]